MDIMEQSLKKHEECLTLAYTPGVARPGLEMQKDEDNPFP